MGSLNRALIVAALFGGLTAAGAAGTGPKSIERGSGGWNYVAPRRIRSKKRNPNALRRRCRR